MKLTLAIPLAAFILSAAALPSHLDRRDCQPAAGVATDGNQYWADNCDLGAGDDGFGQRLARSISSTMDAVADALAPRDCQPAAGVATDGNQYWADNCDLGAGEDGWGQKFRRSLSSMLRQ